MHVIVQYIHRLVIGLYILVRVLVIVRCIHVNMIIMITIYILELLIFLELEDFVLTSRYGHHTVTFL